MGFSLKSGHRPDFKQVGSSPLTKPKYGTYKEAYDAQSDAKRATQSEAEFTTAAKDWNAKQAAKSSDDTVKGTRSNKPAKKQSIQAKPIENKVNKQGLQAPTPGKAGDVDMSHRGSTGSRSDGSITTKKSRTNKSDTLVVSEGRTKGGSTVVNKDYATPQANQTPKSSTSKVKASDRRADKKGLDRQERKNYNDLQKAKKGIRKSDAKASRVQGRKDKANSKDAANNKALLAKSDAKKAKAAKSANLDKAVANLGKKTRGL